jgi:hypothetical protein
LLRANEGNRYRYGRFYLSIPPGIATRTAATRTFRYRLLRFDGEVAGAADCTIPATGRAVDLVSRFFRLAGDADAGNLQGGTCWVGPDGDIHCQAVSGTAIMEPGDQCDPTIHFGCPDDTGSGGSSFWEYPTEPWGEETGGGDDPTIHPIPTGNRATPDCR